MHVTDGRFTDSSPAFTGDGRNLVFLSRRGFEMVHDSHTFDLVITHGTRPYLLPLAAGAPSPFAPSVEGKAADGGDPGDGAVTVDLAGLDGRIVPLPVPEARYFGLRPVKGGLTWLKRNPDGTTVLERFDLDKRKTEELASEVRLYSVSGDGSRIALRDGSDMRVISATGKNGDGVSVDLDRVRVRADPRPALAAGLRRGRADHARLLLGRRHGRGGLGGGAGDVPALARPHRRRGRLRRPDPGGGGGAGRLARLRAGGAPPLAAAHRPARRGPRPRLRRDVAGAADLPLGAVGSRGPLAAPGLGGYAPRTRSWPSTAPRSTR